MDQASFAFLHRLLFGSPLLSTTYDPISPPHLHLQLSWFSVAQVSLISTSSPPRLSTPFSHHGAWLPSLSLVADMGMHHYQAWLTVHVVGSLGPTRGQWHGFPHAENMNFEQHFLARRGPSWSGLIRGSMREWRRKKRGGGISTKQ